MANDLSEQGQWWAERRAVALEILAERRAGKTLVQIAKERNISRERVRQYEVRGLQVEMMLASGHPKYELSVRVRNCLLNEGCKEITPEEIATKFKSVYELRRIPNMGNISVMQVQQWLQRHGQKMLEGTLEW